MAIFVEWDDLNLEILKEKQRRSFFPCLEKDY